MALPAARAPRRDRAKVAPDCHETLVADFERPDEDDVNIEDDRVQLDSDAPQATRGRGCLKIDLTPDEPAPLAVALSGEDLADHDWLEYDVVGAPAQGVLVETAFYASGHENAFARSGTVIDRSPWVGQLLLAELVGDRAGGDVRVEFQLATLGPKTVLHLDAVRLVRDRPPALPPGLGGAFNFARSRKTVWPGFELIDPTAVRLGEGQWEWHTERLPQISGLDWPDPIMREVLGAGSLDRHQMDFALSLRLRPGRYEGLIFAAPITRYGLKRAEHELTCNGQPLTARRWPTERMLTEDGLFAGRDARDLGAEAVRELWVDPTFLALPFSASANAGRITFESFGMYLAGLIVYPKAHHKAFRAHVDRLVERRRAYFAQQVYACIQPTLPGPPDEPTEAEQKSGLVLLKASPLQLPEGEFIPKPTDVIRDGLGLFGLAGQTVTTAVGVLSLEDLDGVEVQLSRSRGAAVRAMEIRPFPVMWRRPVRLAVPSWLDEATPRPVRTGRVAWYLLEIGIPRKAKGKELAVRLRIAAAKRPALKVNVRVSLAPTLPGLDQVCRGVIYPRNWHSGYLPDLIGVHDSITGELIHDDFGVLRSHGLGATTIHGVWLGGSYEVPRMRVSRALLLARMAARAGLCSHTPGWIDFSNLTTHPQWRRGPGPRLLDVAAATLRGLRTDLNRVGVRVTALLATGLDARDGVNPLTAEETLELARLLRQAGWRALGVMYHTGDLDQDGDVFGAGQDGLIKVIGNLDRVVAPLSMAERLRARWPKLDVELFDPSAGRFSAGFRLWMSKLDGLWTAQVHRRALPYSPFEGVSPTEALLMPFRNRPAPTLRLLAIREGANDYEYAQLLTRLVERRRDDTEAVDKAKRTLETVRRELSEARDPPDGPAQEDRAHARTLRRPPGPSHALMDRHRRGLFDRIVELTRRQ